MAQAANGVNFEIGTFEGSRGRLDPPRSGTLQPLLVTCLGRTGSTWLARLLSCHPEIVCYRPFAHEARVASYWAEVFASLSSAASVRQLLDPTDLHSEYWWAGRTLEAAVLPDESAKWAVEEHLQSLADFCRDRVESFYRQVAGADAGTRFFGEKYAPAASIDALCELYPGLRELVLVRDFRDMAASVLAFNTKRGYLAFGRECVRSDEEYIRRLAERDTADLLSHWEQRCNRAVLVRYEDLVVKLDVTLQSIFEAIGLTSDQRTISRVIASASEKLPAMEFHQTSTDMASSIGRWRNLPVSLRQIVNRELGEVLNKFGYEDEDVTPNRNHESTAKERSIP
jgi:hypothetical protein